MYSPVNDDTENYQANQKEKSPDHSLMPPCQTACPLHMDIREYVDLVAQGRIMEALQIIRNGNPFMLRSLGFRPDHPVATKFQCKSL